MIGIKNAKNNIVATLDSDVVPDKKWLKNLYNYLIENNNEDFPDQVLQELVLTTGKNVSLEQTMNRRNDIIEYLKNYKYEISTTFSELTDNDFEKISNFVSSDSKKWTKRNMLDAMKDIVAINYDTDIDKITFGRKNNNEVYNLSLIHI